MHSPQAFTVMSGLAIGLRWSALVVTLVQNYGGVFITLTF